MEELDLKEIFNVIWHKKNHMILIILVFMLIGVVYTMFFVTPKYKASTTLLLANSSSEATSSATTQTDVNLNQKLVATYSELIKSNRILRQVINNLDIKLTEGQLKGSITVTSVKNTEIIRIDVVTKDSLLSTRIANEIANVFGKEVKDLYKIDNVNVVDSAEQPKTPYNINHTKDIIIFALIGVVVSLAYIFIIYMFDTTVKTAEDIEKAVGKTVLVSIPICESNPKKGGKK